MANRPALCTAIGLLFLALALCGCAEQAVSDYLAGKIRARLVTEIGPARRYKVTVSQQAIDKTMRGHIRWIKIEGEDVEASAGLVIDRIFIDLRNIDYDRRKKAIRKIEKAYFEGRISEGNLNRYAARRVPRADDIQVRLRPEAVQASGSPRLLGVPVQVWVSGKLSLVDEKRVSFVPDELSVVGIHLPQGWAKKLTDRLNPLIDLEAARIPVRIESLAVEPSALKVTGTAIWEEGLFGN
ncbi:MAG: DUF2993 domain-containing protein [Armatimonadetes bacterium]|nr:DUF2993 domain-containing protein [Armatimonadota bacterium]